MMATFRSDGRRLGLRSRNGTRIMSTITNVGKATPAISGGKRESSSCRPRKYQGALEGFGVMPGLAWPSNGACNQTETRIKKAVIATAAMNSLKTNSGKETTISSSLSSRTVDGTSTERRRCSTRSRGAMRARASVAMLNQSPPLKPSFRTRQERTTIKRNAADELQAADVLVGVTGGGYVIEHQEEPGDGQHDEEEEGQSAEAERVRHPNPGAAYAHRMDVKEKVRERRAGRDLVGERKAMTEDRANHLADDREHLIQRRTDNGHEPSWLADQTFRRKARSTMTERSINSFPSGATSRWTRSIGRGAGLKKLMASRKYRLPWQGDLKTGGAALALVACWPVSGSLEIDVPAVTRSLVTSSK